MGQGGFEGGQELTVELICDDEVEVEVSRRRREQRTEQREDGEG